MKITVLGSGTSTGVPQIGCRCEVCRSTDKRDKRLRCSSLVDVDGVKILIDCGPDFREQMLSVPFAKLDAVLITHEHYDHVGGLDDLRPYCNFGDVDVYAEEFCANHLRERIPYCFLPPERRYPGVPSINLYNIEPHVPVTVKGVQIMPLRVMHGNLPILGYRIGDFAYITDMKSIPETEYEYLNGVKLLFVNGLRHTMHYSHQTIEEAIDFSRRVGAVDTYIIHMGHQILPHESEQARLPEGFHLAYDGLVVEFPSSGVMK